MSVEKPMKNRILFLLGVVSVVAGLVFLGIGWHGNAGVSLGVPVSSTKVSFCGAATGGLAFCAICAGILAAIFFVWALVGTAMTKFHRA